MSCDTYQPTNLENCVTLRYTNVILYLYVVCLGMMYKDRKVLGIYTNTSAKDQWNKQASSSNLKIPRFKRRFTDELLVMVLNSVVCFARCCLALSACFLNRKKVALKCKDNPSHSRLRMKLLQTIW